MPFLVSLATWLGGSFLPFIIKRLGKKAGTMLYLAALAGLVAILFAALKGAFNSAMSTASAPTSQWVNFGLALLPSNTFTIISLVAGAHAARWTALYNAKYFAIIAASERQS